MGNNFALEVSNLTKKYGSKTAIDSISFCVEYGQIIGFLGPNGAGKSTTLRILAGIISGDSGVVLIDGKPITTKRHEVKSLIGYMPENNPLPEDLRVDEYLSFMAQLKSISRKQASKEVDNVLEMCDLHRTARNKIIGSLSKGFRQRVGIAAALLGSPKLIILDEPTIGLDPHQLLGIRDLLKTLRGQTTVLFSSHILPEVEVACSHIIIIDSATIVANNTPEKLRNATIKEIKYQLEVNCDQPSLEKIFAKFNATIEIGAALDNFTTYTISIPNSNNVQSNDIPKLILENNIKLNSFVPIKPTLESIFLDLTKAHWKK